MESEVNENELTNEAVKLFTDITNNTLINPFKFFSILFYSKNRKLHEYLLEEIISLQNLRASRLNESLKDASFFEMTTDDDPNIILTDNPNITYFYEPLDIEFFLPLLSNLVLEDQTWQQNSTSTILDLLLNKCSRSIHFALKAYWYIQTATTQKSYQDLLLEVEMAVVNAEKRDGWKFLKHRPSISRSHDFANVQHELFLSKQHRCELFTKQLELVVFLENLSLLLLRSKPENRLEVLRCTLEHAEKESLWKGNYIPATFGYQRHFYILRPISEESYVLPSRKKTPFMFVVEVFDTGRLCGDGNLADIVNLSTTKIDNTETKTTQVVVDESESHGKQPPNLFGELWSKVKERVRAKSPFAHLYSISKWSILPFIFKYGDDCRQECLAMQIVTFLGYIFRSAGLELLLRPYHIAITGENSCIIEAIPNSISIHMLKKQVGGDDSKLNLSSCFELCFGEVENYSTFRSNFIKSMAAYSIITYVLSLKDRHNGNILITHDGSIIHIDFDFMLGISPGANFGFEASPFKLTREYIDVLGGEDSSSFADFRRLVLLGMLEVRRHTNDLVLMLEMMCYGCPDLPCFKLGIESVVEDLKERCCVNLSEEKCIEHSSNLVDLSINHWTSVQYDSYQRICNFIL